MKSTIKMKSYKNKIPINSLTQEFLPAHYADFFDCDVVGVRKLSADELQIGFWTIMPFWVSVLFKLKNILVSPFGLDTKTNNGQIDDIKKMILNGGKAGLISMAKKSECETVLLLSDKHLNAYMSVMVEQK